MKQLEPEAREIALAAELITEGSLNVFAHHTDVEPGHGLLRVSGAVIPFDCTIPHDTELYRLMDTRPGRV